MENRQTLLVVLLFILVFPAARVAFMLGNSTRTVIIPRIPPASPQQGVAGNITIANPQSLCAFRPGIVPAQGPNLVAQSIGEIASSQTIIEVNWNLEYGCTLVGTFRAQLNPGAYNLTLTSCLQDPRSVGCPGSFSPRLPVLVQVRIGQFAQVNIRITTGIY